VPEDSEEFEFSEDDEETDADKDASEPEVETALLDCLTQELAKTSEAKAKATNPFFMF